MTNFTFQKSRLEVNINQISFSVDTGSNEVGKVLNEFSKMINDKDIVYEDVILLCKNTINGLLQDSKAVEDIFKDRAISLDELCDVIEYLISEITTFKQNRLQRYVSFEEN